MVHGENRIPYWIDRRLTGLAELNMMPPSHLGWPMSLKTTNTGNVGWVSVATAIATALAGGVAEYVLTGGTSTWIPLLAGLETISKWQVAIGDGTTGVRTQAAAIRCSSTPFCRSVPEQHGTWRAML